MEQNLAGISDFIALINFQTHWTITSVQTAVSFLVRAFFIPFLADKIKIIPINGKSRTAIDVSFPTGISPSAQGSLDVLLFRHLSFPAARILNSRTLSRDRHKTQYGKNTGYSYNLKRIIPCEQE
jgi:hypothetical protein